jgi:hypothetical protein
MPPKWYAMMCISDIRPNSSLVDDPLVQNVREAIQNEEGAVNESAGPRPYHNEDRALHGHRRGLEDNQNVLNLVNKQAPDS